MPNNEKISDRELVSAVEESTKSPETLRVLKQIRLLFVLILATSTAAAVFSFMSLAGTGVALHHRPHPHHGEFGMMHPESRHGRFEDDHNDEFKLNHHQLDDEVDFKPRLKAGHLKPCKKGKKHARPEMKHGDMLDKPDFEEKHEGRFKLEKAHKNDQVENAPESPTFLIDEAPVSSGTPKEEVKVKLAYRVKFEDE